MPFALAVLGLLLVNGQSIARFEGQSPTTLALGIGASLAAVALWVWFGLANQRSADKKPGMNAWVWTAMMIGGSLQTLLFIPVGTAMDVFNAPMLGFGQSAISHLYLPAFVLAAVASIGGAWAWRHRFPTPSHEHWPVSCCHWRWSSLPAWGCCSTPSSTN